MPTYDYECDACGHKFDVFQSISEEKLRKCPACRKLKLRRLFGAGAAVVFKGSGFYQTDYRSESYKKGADADKSASAGSDSGSADKSTKSSDSSSTTKSASDSATKPKT